jgi:glycosyltransferase involved in cell wall biosynthesis
MIKLLRQSFDFLDGTETAVQSAVPLPMATAEPLLTIAIPTFNYAHFLPDAISSILRQGLDDFEILIVDNASEDNTEEVVRSFGGAHIRYIRNPSNLGSSENGNRCLVNSRGRYIKFLCADDVLLEGVLRKQLNILEKCPEVALVTCGYLFTDPYLNIQGSWSAFPGSHTGRRVINLCLSRMTNSIGGPSNIMIRRAVSTGIFSDASYRVLADLKFSLQILEHGDYVNIDEPGYLYRKHPNSDYAINCPPEIQVPEYLRLVDEFNWSNPLNCVLAFLSGDIKGRQFAEKHWLLACAPNRLAKSLAALVDLLYVRFRRFVDKRKLVQRGSKLSPNIRV